jgi:uncharacterized membrane protein
LGVKVGYEVADQSLSAGGAVVGGIVAGGIGALAGASMGGKKVQPNLTISYKDASGNDCRVLLLTNSAEKLKKKLDKQYHLAV